MDFVDGEVIIENQLDRGYCQVNIFFKIIYYIPITIYIIYFYYSEKSSTISIIWHKQCLISQALYSDIKYNQYRKINNL